MFWEYLVHDSSLHHSVLPSGEVLVHVIVRVLHIANRIKGRYTEFRCTSEGVGVQYSGLLPLRS